MLYLILPFGLLTLAVTAGIMLHYVYFAFLPQRAIRKYQQSDPERLRRYLGRVVATPSFIGPAQKLVPRSALMQMALAGGRYSEAAAHGRAILEHLPSRAHVTGYTSIEANIRFRLADCLEALGEVDEAATERRMAQECVDRAPADPRGSLTQGKLLEREHRFEEACTAFEKALSLTPESNQPARIECMNHLALAYHNAGRPGDSLHWAERVITLGPKPISLRTAHRLAALACGSLGRLQDSEDHYRLAYRIAVEERNDAAIGQILGALADIQRKRGKLAEAHEASLMIADVDPKAIRTSIALQAMILREWGRFDEALAMLGRHDAADNMAIPANERRVRAARALDQSRIEAECGRADDAWVHLQEAVTGFGNDARLGLKCDAVTSWVFAARGLADDSRRVADQVEERLPEFETDPGTCRSILYDLGMAAWTRGDHEPGIGCWDRYLNLNPDPVHQPTALYVRGECRRLQGDLAGAKADFRDALAREIDTYYARLARSRLDQISSP